VNVVFFLLGDSPLSEFHVPKLRTFCLFHFHRSREQGVNLLVHMTYENGTECSETSAPKIQTLWNHPKKEYNMFNEFSCIPVTYS